MVKTIKNKDEKKTMMLVIIVILAVLYVGLTSEGSSSTLIKELEIPKIGCASCQHVDWDDQLKDGRRTSYGCKRQGDTGLFMILAALTLSRGIIKRIEIYSYATMGILSNGGLL